MRPGNRASEEPHRGGFTTDAIHDYLDHLTGEGKLIVLGHNDAEILRLLTPSLIALNA